MFVLMPVVFILGILGIAFEDKIKINKSATALIMCVLLWGMLIVNFSGRMCNSEDFTRYVRLHNTSGGEELKLAQGYVSQALTEHLGDVAGTLFFVLCSMLIVNTVDRYGGFKEITVRLSTMNKRRLLWSVSLIAFFFSALLDNLAAAIVLMAILHKLVPDRTDRLKYACMCIIACNAGGAWSPIGDVTTLILWVNGRITAPHQITTLFLPAFFNMLIPLIVCHYFLFKKGAVLRQEPEDTRALEHKQEISPKRRITILCIGIFSLALVPIYQMFLGIPAFLGAIIGLIILWVYTDIMFERKHGELKNDPKLRVVNLLHDADLATIFYFLGILMSVAALTTGGQLAIAGRHMDKFAQITNDLTVNNAALAWVIGVCSSFVDNVALVAATMGMYPLGHNTTMVLDGSFWTFLAYTAVTGGSLLIIGSATGVTVMGLEKISFGYYFRRFSGLALLGYIAGTVVYALLLLF